MKRIVLSVLVAAACSTAMAQTKKPVAKPAAKPAVTLKNIKDSASYAIGVSVANFYKQQGITSVNATIVAKAIDDILSGKKVLLDDAAANACMNTFMKSSQEQKSKPAIEEGKVFLVKNKSKAGVKITPSGLQYEVIKEGTGDMPSAADTVTCNYMGTFLNGKEFDNSYKRGEAATFPLGNVIPGWTEGLQLMHIGSKYKFYVPYTIGYGPNDYGEIPGGSTLVFEIELLGVKKAQ
ncbi:MAG: FKBP-type peptidyl-prolyl cis-trans isomerase [Ferruginibacter sp.]